VKNSDVFWRWLVENCTTNGVTDGSVLNMRQAVGALHRAKVIKWKIAPKPFSEKMEGPKLRSHATAPEEKPKDLEQIAREGLVKDREEKAVITTLRRVDNYTDNVSHAEKGRRRADLKKKITPYVEQWQKGEMSPEAVDNKLTEFINVYDG
jgi:hypothetical protein